MINRKAWGNSQQGRGNFWNQRYLCSVSWNVKQILRVTEISKATEQCINIGTLEFFMVYGNDFNYRPPVQFQTSRLEAININNWNNIPKNWNNVRGSRVLICKHLSWLSKVITVLEGEKKSRISSVGLCCTILLHKSQNFTRMFLKVSNGKQQNKGKKKKKKGQGGGRL